VCSSDLLKNEQQRLIVPMAFPKPIDIQDPYDGMLVPLSSLKEWEMAPYNAYLLHKAGVPFAITAALNRQPKEFLSNLRASVANGLPEHEALKALTLYPAEILGIQDITGSLHAGKLANFVIVKGNLFKEKIQIHETWIQGKRHDFKPLKELSINGIYTLNVAGRIRTLHILDDREFVILRDKDTTEAIVIRDERKITVSYHETDSLTAGTVRLSGMIHLDGAAWDGQGQWTDGTWINWNAIKKAPKNATQAPKNTEKTANSGNGKPMLSGKKGVSQDTIPVPAYTYPLGAYGFDSIPDDRPILIKNVTIWTSESIGILQGSVLIRNGKIHKIGNIEDAADPKTLIIDGTGKHLTAGIIDEHSHIAASGSVNEGGQNNSAEVRLGDVIDATDINIYRQLAGGVTCAQILHGSANPIGGQSAVIKLKWGHQAGDMLLNPQPKYIKFALGENVKQSNWGESQTIRFPQSRMGVEQVYYDAFISAREYDEAWKRYNEAPANKKKKAEIPMPRRDLELETLAEILRGERFITCHSYVQSEIVMLMRVADSMGFTLNTFTHILEGYKVADKMKKHGAGASSFSDWWAYKYEVKDAIPYNAAILNKMGIVTALNSDDAEMGRRLNQEAAKAVKYGGVSEEDALKMVTLNPAKLLRIDHRTGSIKEGKDADLVLWNGHPLSMYSQVEKTIIDGRIYFDREQDNANRQRDAKEKARLLGKMIEAKQNGVEMRPLFPDDKYYFKCADN
jgi:imidazolonepropionase-like amidohydrolase